MWTTTESTVEARVECCACGGSGGQPEVEFDPTAAPTAWHDCYHCLNTGRCWC